MSGSEFHHYTRDEFLAEFYPDPADRAAVTAGMEQLRAEQRAFRLAEMRRRLGTTRAQVAARMGITQGRCPPSSTPSQHHRAAHPRRLLRPSAAAWRSSPTSATSGSPSPNPAPKQPDRPATATRQKLAAKRQPGNAPRAQGSTLGSLALLPDAAISGNAAGWRAPSPRMMTTAIATAGNRTQSELPAAKRADRRLFPMSTLASGMVEMRADQPLRRCSAPNSRLADLPVRP